MTSLESLEIQIARVAMYEAEGTDLSLPALRAKGEELATKPECIQQPAFGLVEDVKQWALLLYDSPASLWVQLGPDIRHAVSVVAEDAWEELEARRGLEADIQAEIDANDDWRRMTDLDADLDPGF